MDKPLNELTAEAYFEDYMLYLSAEFAEQDANQRQLTTYFAEFEHQEGRIQDRVKAAVANMMVEEYMKPVQEAMKKMQDQLEGWVDILVKHKGPDVEGEKPATHESIQEYVQGFIYAVERGIDKGGY